ncbi:MAG TPA: ATP-dependent RNA helicase [Gammaproteobacteria bacterium]|nr:ATP-dependent RNA helicase [Gammaproteobacteria bacterium]
MSDNSSSTVTFKDLALSDALLKALDEVGYETPSPVQAATIPVLLEGSDIVGQAQTGSGKTAAFALPMLSRIDLKNARPQVLVLAPTRELAIQVAEAFQRYASHMRGFHVLPIYGGQDYKIQLRALNRGVHVVVGTPGRVIDHMRKRTLKLDHLKALVLDEADEMLRMGFIDDVEWVLEQTPPTRQIALFSATMPKDIRRIARRHLQDPQEISIKQKTATAETIRQRYWMVSGTHKLDALTRILEAETLDATLIFVRTKIATVELAEKLEARGYAAAPLSGDIQQKQRERTVDQLKRGRLDIIVATDVAARGLDVQRISHVINYDVPHDTESYIHRIGRTGRAGREGDAILFIAPREKRMLYAIEKATRKKIEQMQLPSTADINDKRIVQFKQNITDAIAAEGETDFYLQLVEQYHQEHNVPAIEIAAALAKLLQGDVPLLLKDQPKKARQSRGERPQGRDSGREGGRREGRRGNREDGRGESARGGRESRDRADRGRGVERSAERRQHQASGPAEGMERYRLEVGHKHKVKPGNIVGAIANEAGLDSQYINRIVIHDDYSTVELPHGMPRDIFRTLKKTWVCGTQLKIRKDGEEKKPRKELHVKKRKDSDHKSKSKKRKPKRG